MTLAQSRRQDGRLTVPCIMLTLALLALTVSLFGLQRATNIVNERMGQLQQSWSTVQDGPIEGSDIVETNRLMDRLSMPMPAAGSAANWSLALALASLLFVIWLLVALRRDHRDRAAIDKSDTQSERAALIRLTDEIAPVSIGDLCVHATRDNDLTSPLADAFNYLIGEMRWFVTTIDSSAQLLDQSVERTQKFASEVIDDSARQTERIHESSNSLLSMSATMADLSTSSSSKTSLARAIVDKAVKENRSFEDTINQLTSAASDADSVGVSLKRLTDTLTAIDEQITGMQDVTKRTDLLALNTAIRMRSGAGDKSITTPAADTVGDVGKLSDEVAQMSTLLGQATCEIELLSRELSKGLSEAVILSGKTREKLESGIMNARETEDSLRVIASDARSIEQHLLTISETTVKQSGIVSQLSENLDDVNQLTQQSAERIRQGADSLDELTDLSAELRSGVVEFRMPGKADPAEAPKVASSAARRAADRAVIHG